MLCVANAEVCTQIGYKLLHPTVPDCSPLPFMQLREKLESAEAAISQLEGDLERQSLELGSKTAECDHLDDDLTASERRCNHLTEALSAQKEATAQRESERDAAVCASLWCTCCTLRGTHVCVSNFNETTSHLY